MAAPAGGSPGLSRSPGGDPVDAALADTAAGNGPADDPGITATSTSEELVRAGASGALWLGGAQVVGKAMVLLTTIVLARLLVPEQFGLVSLSLVLLVYAEAITDAGVAQALIYLPRTAASARAALACSLATGAALTLVVQLAAPFIADFFDQPTVEPLVRLLSLSLLASSLSAVPDALLRRSLKFNRITISTVVRSVVTGIVSILLALTGSGAWALAWGTVAGALVYVAMTWTLATDRPDLAIWRTRWSDVRGVMGYGVPVAGSSLLSKLVFDVDYLIIGRLLGVGALGYYTLAFRLPELLILNMLFVLSAVVFPIYSRVRGDLGRLQSGYLFSLRIYSLYGVCAGVGIAVTAPLVVPLFFGQQWDDAITPLLGLALYGVCRSLSGGANEVYKALGRPWLSLVVSIGRLIVLVPALTIAALNWGIVGVAWGQCVTSLLFSVVTQLLAARLLQMPWRRLAGAIAPSLVAGAAVGIAGVLLAFVPLPSIPHLALIVVGGAVAALGTLYFCFPSVLRELTAIVRSRRPAAAA